MRLLSSTFVFVGYVHFAVNLYGVVVNTIVGYEYKLWLAFGYGSDNQISFIYGGRIYVYLYCFVFNFNYVYEFAAFAK